MAHMLSGCQQLTTRFRRPQTGLPKPFENPTNPLDLPNGNPLSHRRAAKSHCGKELWPINKITGRNRKLAFVCGQSTFSIWHLGIALGLGVNQNNNRPTRFGSP